MPETDCTCPYTDPSTWLSAASCGYGSGYEPGSMQEWDPDCPQHPAAPETETDANGLTEGVLRELGVCEFHEMATDASMCRCGLPAVNHDTFAEQIVMSDHPTVARLLERVRVVEGERDAARAEAAEMSGWIEEHALVKTYARIADWQEATGAELPGIARAAMHAYAARTESAEAAHEAEKAAHERLRAEVEALAKSWADEAQAGRTGNGHALLVQTYDGHARALTALLGGGETR